MTSSIIEDIEVDVSWCSRCDNCTIDFIDEDEAVCCLECGRKKDEH